MELVEFILSDFWHFVGALVLIWCFAWVTVLAVGIVAAAITRVIGK